MAKREGYRIDKSKLALSVTKSITKIDKSTLEIGTRNKVTDYAYRRSFKDRTCEASTNGIDLCGLPCVGAHVRTGECAGTGTKPSDDLLVGLCHAHHADQEANPGPEW